jgi:translation initiation factor 3 subunit J
VEKEADRKRRLENGEFDEEYLDMREKFMDEKEMRRIMREKELEADMDNASDLFGAATLQPTSSGSTKGGSRSAVASAPKLPPHLAPFLSLPAKLTTKADFDALSRLIYTNLIQPHATSGHYAAFVETHTKALCSTLKEGETRKVANVVSGLVTEKAAAARAAAKKKPGATAVVSGKGIFAGEGGGKGK